ncbi:hypothetical protein ACTD5D_13750 [Nocardia takedensis]|uniref:hypothetical protein n=1 Tax=Nocardia takedensis TaxID=259390 RepID=UPI0002E19CA0|nr:hypothetical protein [Nocardia takedensis]
MTDTPSPAPRDPVRDAPGRDADVSHSAPSGQHAGSGQPVPAPNTGPARHEMPGDAGYPQFSGPGAPQYGEPVEPPPAVGQPQPTYGPEGTGPAHGDSDDYPVYGYQHSVPTGLDVGQALGYGVEKFRANPAPWLGITAMGVVIYLVFYLLVQTFEPRTPLPVMVIFLIVLTGIWLLQGAMVRGALYETDGNRPVFGSYFQYVNAGNVLLTALLAFIATSIGFALCVLPGLLVGWLCMFSLHYVVDQDLGPFDAIKSSATLVLRNAGQTALLALAVMVLALVGTLLCGLGLLLAGPVSVIAVTAAYRGLTGGTLAS